MIPEGTPAGQNPTPYTGAAGVRAADVQPDERLHGRCRQADLHQLRAADRRPGDGRAGDPHLVGPAGARPVLLDQRHPGALAAAGLLARQAPSSTSTRAAPSRALPFPSSWWPPSTTRRTRWRSCVTGRWRRPSRCRWVGGRRPAQTPNGTYYVLEKFPTIVMDSSTYGVPVNSAEGYKLNVQLAVRIDNSGDFVHSAPWSVGDQGKRNVSHGCINISPDNAKWFYDNFGSGDPVVIKNSRASTTSPTARRTGRCSRPVGAPAARWCAVRRASARAARRAVLAGFRRVVPRPLARLVRPAVAVPG